MQKTIYEVMEASKEFKVKDAKEINQACTSNYDDSFIKPLNERFENKQEALEFLSNLESEVRFYEGFAIPYYKVTEFFVEENVYNECDDWLSGGDVLGYSKMNFKFENGEA